MSTYSRTRAVQRVRQLHEASAVTLFEFVGHHYLAPPPPPPRVSTRDENEIVAAIFANASNVYANNENVDIFSERVRT